MILEYLIVLLQVQLKEHVNIDSVAVTIKSDKFQKVSLFVSLPPSLSLSLSVSFSRTLSLSSSLLLFSLSFSLSHSLCFSLSPLHNFSSLSS